MVLPHHRNIKEVMAAKEITTIMVPTTITMAVSSTTTIMEIRINNNRMVNSNNNLTITTTTIIVVVAVDGIRMETSYRMRRRIGITARFMAKEGMLVEPVDSIGGNKTRYVFMQRVKSYCPRNVNSQSKDVVYVNESIPS
jgi:hypothetical protein